MPPKKKGGSVSSGGSKKKKKKGSKKGGKTVIPNEIILPPITSPNYAILNASVLARDSRTMDRLIAHYDYGKGILEVDVNGSTLIHQAVKRQDVAMLRHLLSYQQIPLDICESKSVGGHNALHHACLLNDLSIMEMLLQAGANPNMKSNNLTGETPLMLCCQYGYVSCAKLLLQYGASVDMKDNFGNNISFWAYEHNQLTLVRELNLPPMHTATADEYIKLLLQRNPNFILPTINKKKKKKSGGGKKKKK
jgi:hypothetical protein